MNSFISLITFQVKPDRLDDFEALIENLSKLQEAQPGCIALRYFKRAYTFDGVEWGQPPRELTRIVKCVKYYVQWEFDSPANCGGAMGWFFENYNKEIMKLLIMPFEINSGYSI